MPWGKWVKKARAEGLAGERPLTEDERAELEHLRLEHLREENQRLRMEAEFAKKVATWFAKDPR
jgi:transposase